MSVYKIEKTTIQCDGEDHNIVVSSFPAMQGLKIQLKISKLVLPVLGNFLKDNESLDKLSDGSILSKIDVGKISKALMSSLDEKTFGKLVLEMLSGTRVNDKEVGNSGIFDLVFTAKFDLLFDVIKFVMEVNFKSFLDKFNIFSQEESTLK